MLESIGNLPSSESLQAGASELQSVLSKIGANFEVVEIITETLENYASVSRRSQVYRIAVAVNHFPTFLGSSLNKGSIHRGT